MLPLKYGKCYTTCSPITPRASPATARYWEDLNKFNQLETTNANRDLCERDSDRQRARNGHWELTSENCKAANIVTVGTSKKPPKIGKHVKCMLKTAKAYLKRAITSEQTSLLRHPFNVATAPV